MTDSSGTLGALGNASGVPAYSIIVGNLPLGSITFVNLTPNATITLFGLTDQPPANVNVIGGKFNLALDKHVVPTGLGSFTIEPWSDGTNAVGLTRNVGSSQSQFVSLFYSTAARAITNPITDGTMDTILTMTYYDQPVQPRNKAAWLEFRRHLYCIA